MDFRRTTRSRHQAKPGVPSCSWVKRDAAASYIYCPRGKCYYEKNILPPGLCSCSSGLHPPLGAGPHAKSGAKEGGSKKKRKEDTSSVLCAVCGNPKPVCVEPKPNCGVASPHLAHFRPRIVDVNRGPTLVASSSTSSDRRLCAHGGPCVLCIWLIGVASGDGLQAATFGCHRARSKRLQRDFFSVVHNASSRWPSSRTMPSSVALRL